MITRDNCLERMSEDMRLRDYRPKTQRAYLWAVKQLVTWLDREPALWTEEDIRKFFLYLREEKKAAPSSINVILQGIRFFLRHTMELDWPVLEIIGVNLPRKLPVVLSRKEVRAVLSVVRDPMRRMALTTIYGLGLRLGETLRLRAEHIDSDRLMVWVRDGKGTRDRGVVLPRPLLFRLRRYWKEVRTPAPSSHLFVSPKTGKPPHSTTLQKTFSAARKDAAITKDASIHTLRHSYATHLLESGVTIPTIQRLLGHRRMQTTMIYMHVTHPSSEQLQATIDQLMADL